MAARNQRAIRVTLDRNQFRDRRRYVAAVASEMLAPALSLLARRLSRGGASRPHTWRNGIILGNGHIGDVLYRTCSLEHLANEIPECRWSYLTTEFAAPVLEGNPSIDEILPLCRNGGAASVPARGRAELAARRFDVALCTENTRHHESLVLALRLGIPNRVAFVQKGLSGLATRAVLLPTLISRPAQFRAMVEEITESPDRSPLRPRVYPSSHDRDAAAREWVRLGVNNAEPLVACAVTTRQAIGSFSPDFFRDIMDRIVEISPRARFLLIGSAVDASRLHEIAAAVGAAAIVSAGVLNVRELVPLLERCHVFLGSDSGPRHLANAAGIPVFFVRNMEGRAAETDPYCDSEVDIAPAGEYLSAVEMSRAARVVDRHAVASAIVAAGQHRARDTRADMLR